ncbi:MAG: hypothetical protein PSX71_08610 [bacterium]|nr:hypothetical protein [bacterium]
MSQRSLWRSFVTGEVTPELVGRLDLDKVQAALATCRNFIVLPHGPVSNRPGTQFVKEVKTSANVTRLIPFTYSASQTMAIEVGAGYFRFFSNAGVLQLSATPAAYSGATTYNQGDMCSSGGVNYYCIATTIANAPPNAAYWYAMPADGSYEIPNPFAAADLMDIHYTQSADVMTLVHPNYAPCELRRAGANNWSLTLPAFTPPLNCPTAITAVATTGTGTTLYQYVVTSVNGTLSQESIAGSSPTGTQLVISGATQAASCVISIPKNQNEILGITVGDLIGISGVVGMTALNGNSYTISAISGNTGRIGWGIPGSTLVSVTIAVNSTAFGAYVSGGLMAPGGIKNDLSVAGNKNTISWTPPAGTAPLRYNVYKLSNGVWGYIGQAAGTSFVDQNITPDISKTPPLYEPIFAAAGDYPAAVTYFEQRRCFGGTNNAPQNVWMTRSGTESDMGYTIPVRADNRIALRIAAREASAVRHLVPVANLMMLTPSCEYKAASVSSDALTPLTISVKPQSYIGANNVTPIVVGNSVLFAQARGGHIREMSYNWQANGYLTNDISLLAPHLFNYLTITDMAYSRAPYPILWAVSSGGNLLGMTYVPEQQVAAWHRHDTDGVFESICTITENNEDMLYCIVRRTVNGSSKRYVERLHTRYFATAADAFFVDCGSTYYNAGTYSRATTTATCIVAGHGITNGTTRTLKFSNSALTGAYVVTVVDANTFTVTTSTGSDTGTVEVQASSLSGLSWLEGKTVSILGDGAVFPQKAVTSGAITLDQPCSKIQVGLPITADLQTLPLSVMIDSAAGQGKTKNVNKVWLRVVNSSGIFAGPSFAKLTEAKERFTEPMGTAPALKTQEISIMVTPAWVTDGAICIRQIDPLPLTVLSVALDFATG